MFVLLDSLLHTRNKTSWTINNRRKCPNHSIAIMHWVDQHPVDISNNSSNYAKMIVWNKKKISVKVKGDFLSRRSRTVICLRSLQLSGRIALSLIKCFSSTFDVSHDSERPWLKSIVDLELMKVQDEIVTLRQVLGAKLKRESELKTLLGVGFVEDLKQDWNETVSDIKSTTAYQKTAETLNAASEKMAPTFQTVNSTLKSGLGSLRSTALTSSRPRSITSFFQIRPILKRSKVLWAQPWRRSNRKSPLPSRQWISMEPTTMKHWMVLLGDRWVRARLMMSICISVVMLLPMARKTWERSKCSVRVQRR